MADGLPTRRQRAAGAFGAGIGTGLRDVLKGALEQRRATELLTQKAQADQEMAGTKGPTTAELSRLDRNAQRALENFFDVNLMKSIPADIKVGQFDVIADAGDRLNFFEKEFGADLRAASKVMREERSKALKTQGSTVQTVRDAVIAAQERAKNLLIKRWPGRADTISSWFITPAEEEGR